MTRFSQVPELLISCRNYWGESVGESVGFYQILWSISGKVPHPSLTPFGVGNEGHYWIRCRFLRWGQNQCFCRKSILFAFPPMIESILNSTKKARPLLTLPIIFGNRKLIDSFLQQVLQLSYPWTKRPRAENELRGSPPNIWLTVSLTRVLLLEQRKVWRDICR